MNTIRRVTSSVMANINWMIGQVENHEALVEAAMREANEAGARAKVQLKRVQQDGLQLRKRLSDLRTTELLWTNRAKNIAKQDEQKAIECLKRRKRIQQELQQIEEQEREHSTLEIQLSSDLAVIDDKLRRLKSQKNLMRTRQSRAEALRSLQNEDSQLFTEIDSIFERWETKVTQYEVQSNLSTDKAVVDELEEAFVSAEEDQELRDSLRELLNNK